MRLIVDTVHQYLLTGQQVKMEVYIQAISNLFCMGKDWKKNSLLSNECFQNTVMVWIPCGWLWLSLVGYIPYLRRQRSYSSIPVTALDVIKMVLSGLLAIVYMANALKLIVNEDNDKNDLFSANVILFATMILSMILQFVEWKKRLITSGVNFIFSFLVFFTMGITFFIKNFEGSQEERNIPEFVQNIMNLILNFFLVVAFSFANSNCASKELTAVEKASFLSRITFFWMTRIMIKGCQRKLSEKEVPNLLASEQAKDLHQKFIRTQKKLCGTSSADKSVSLIKVFFKIYWKEITITFIFRLLYDILIFCNPLLLNIFMKYLKSDSGNENKSIGYVYSLLFFTINVILVLLDQTVFARGWKTGIKVSTTLMSIIYDKILKIGMQTSENGPIINLLSTDVSIFREFIPYLFILWSGPLQMVICFVILFCLMGKIAAYSFLIIPVIILFVIISRKIEKRLNEYYEMKNKRIKLLDEMIEYIKSLKFFAHEDIYLKKLEKIREKEINNLKKRVYYECFISTLGEMTPHWITLLIFITLSLINDINTVTTEHIFVTIMALNLLETNMSMYSDCIFDIIKAKESYKNIFMFLKTQESCFKPDEIHVERSSLDLLLKNPTEIPASVYSVVITNATFKDNCLKNINLKIKVGQLVAVCGNNNSGKSALLYIIQGQIKKESGTVCRLGNIAVTPQEPWVINDTVKNNILFGKNCDKRRFQQTLKYCCLNEDVKEDTIINGKGSNLSKGQLYRINLARAVYSRPHIFLLDNPLCAIDVSTARKISSNLLGENGLLKKITRIIVTQPTAHWLPKANQIIVMDSNTIAESGTFEELMVKKGKFVQLREQCLQNQELKQREREDTSNFLRYQPNRPVLQTTSQVGSKFWKSSSTKFKNKSVLDYNRIGTSESFNRNLSRMLYMNKKSLKITRLKFQDTSAENSNFKVARLVFRNYLKSIGFFSLLSTIIMGILFEGFKTSSNYLFENWSNQIHLNSTMKKNYNLVYAGSFSVVAGIFSFLFGILSTYLTAKASCSIHHSIAKNIFHKPLSFFEKTDQGAIELIFTDNMNDVDYELPNFYQMWVKDFLRIITAVVLFSFCIPLLAVVLLLIIIIFVILSVVFILATSLLQDFYFKFHGYLYTHFLETESGTLVINAFKNENIFIDKAYIYIDNSQKFFSSIIAAKRWSGFLLQFIGCVIILLACFYFVAVEEKSRVGLVLTYLILAVKCFDWVVRTSSDIAIKRVSLHEIQKYRNQDSSLQTTEKEIPNWPSAGEIEFLNYSATYDKSGSSNCLNDINLCIKPREKVGIIGKSGSGKSSLVMALTHLISCEKGQINIDGKNIKSIDPNYLRSKLTIFPQNTHLFTGDLRSNLDPEGKFTDEKLTSVLADVHLDGQYLDKTCESFSVGEKQLVGLAKCILNKTKVLILDECTANICATQDKQIQQIIEEKFSDCTVLNIAHKIAMVEKCDKILVMDQGEVKEFDSPNNLLKKKSSFYMKLKEEELRKN